MDPTKILSRGGLNTLMFTDPYAKLCYTVHLASKFDRIIYIDLDTTFTAYFNAGFVHTNSIVDIYLPSEGRLAAMTKDVLESMGDSSLVIFDSVNSFYNLFPIRRADGQSEPPAFCFDNARLSGVGSMQMFQCLLQACFATERTADGSSRLRAAGSSSARAL